MPVPVFPFYICSMSVSTFIILIIIGLLAGLLSGLVGVGGGILMIPLLIIFLGLTQHEAQGTALFAMLPPIGILAAINYYKEGFVKWEYAIVIAFTFVIGGYLGSKLSLSLPPQMVRRIFGVIMLLGAIKLISSK
ncbi:MAG: Uncharacterised protein [Cryomorphaceae bacterium]|nr:MAG: Uncharacterised protein [Cryomorphaceae bacterium]